MYLKANSGIWICFWWKGILQRRLHFLQFGLYFCMLQRLEISKHLEWNSSFPFLRWVALEASWDYVRPIRGLTIHWGKRLSSRNRLSVRQWQEQKHLCSATRWDKKELRYCFSLGRSPRKEHRVGSEENGQPTWKHELHRAWEG